MTFSKYLLASFLVLSSLIGACPIFANEDLDTWACIDSSQPCDDNFGVFRKQDPIDTWGYLNVTNAQGRGTRLGFTQDQLIIGNMAIAKNSIQLIRRFVRHDFSGWVTNDVPKKFLITYQVYFATKDGSVKGALFGASNQALMTEIDYRISSWHPLLVVSTNDAWTR